MFDIIEARKRKESYLNDPFCKYDINTKPLISRYFKNSEKIEVQFEKDICDFTMDEVIKLLKSFDSRSRNTIILIMSYFNDYFKWCLKEGFVQNNNIINFYEKKIMEPFLKEIVPLEFLENKYITKDELLSYLNETDDYSLKFMIYAIFNSILGDEYEELINLKESDLEEESKTINLITGRKVRIDELFIELMKKASLETYYHPDGIIESNSREKKYYKESFYILKGYGNRGRLENEPIPVQVIQRRMRDYQKIVSNRWLNATNLYRSGLIYYIKNIFEERNISFKDAIYTKINRQEYRYEEEIQKNINEFGSNMTTRMFRLHIKDIIELIS